MPSQRTLTVEELLAWAESSPNAVRLHTGRDALPGGLSASMVPVLVEWGASNHTESDGGYVVRTLNLGGNPIAGTTVLCSAKIPAHAVESVEFIVVPHDRLGKRSLMAHTMLRFVFARGREMQLLSGAGAGTGGDATVPDLILSWEAWRPPGVAYDALKGLDPKAFDLSLRIYSGAQRFLEDAIIGREWFAYPLDLPAGENGSSELLRVGLVLGDSIARRSLDRLLGEAEARWLSRALSSGADRTAQLAQWEKLRQALNDASIPAEPIPGHHGMGYQTLQRSCVTMTLHMLDVAVERLRAAGHSVSPMPRLNLGPQELAPWMEELAHADLFGIFLRAPYALWWLMRHQEVLPRQAVKQLDDAGLLARSGEEATMHHYKLNDETPYGELHDYFIE